MKLTDIIKNLIIEQANESPTYGNQEDSMNKLKKHVGIYFLYLNNMPDIEGYWQEVQNEGVLTSYNYGRENPTRTDLFSGLKISGLNNPLNERGQRMDENIVIYTLLVNYFHNGGKNWKRGDDIELVPSYSHAVDVSFEEDVVEYGTAFLDIYTPSLEKAQELALGPDNYNLEVDRQTDDHDYTGDRRNQEIIDSKTNKHELTPQMFGF
tara:strand:+ start:40 stop:666 length:627 start_codon:yes stop_codon:yes gene_type:complete